MRVLGCDPGLTGAIALWDDALDMLLVHDAPTLTVHVGSSKSRTVYQDAAFAQSVRALAPDTCWIEQVNGVRGQSASASFSFGAGFGLLRGIMAALDIPVSFVAPAKWQAKLIVPKGKDGARLRAAQLFPRHAALFSRVRDHGRADAALIALYGVAQA